MDSEKGVVKHTDEFYLKKHPVRKGLLHLYKLLRRKGVSQEKAASLIMGANIIGHGALAGGILHLNEPLKYKIPGTVLMGISAVLNTKLLQLRLAKLKAKKNQIKSRGIKQ